MIAPILGTPPRPALMDDSTAILKPAANPYEFRGQEPPTLLNLAIGDVRGHTSVLLEQFGFSAGHRGEQPPMFFHSAPRRGPALQWSDAMRAALTRYAGLYERLRLAHSELRPIRRKRPTPTPSGCGTRPDAGARG